MRKIYIVPNIVTTANLFSGFYSVIASIHGDFILASWAIMAAAVFDMLDGRIARLAKATSEFGVQYDSMSDLISFGLAPAILLHQWSLEPFGRLGWLTAFLFCACGALRLARFNVFAHTLPKNYFQGLPIPMAAAIVATFVIFCDSVPIQGSRDNWVIGITLLLSTLMVSTLKFPSFKELNWRSRASFGYLMIGVLGMILIAVRPEVTLFVLLSSYVGLSLVWNIYVLCRGTAPDKRGLHEDQV